MLKIYICEDNSKQREHFKKIVNDYCLLSNLNASIEICTKYPKEILAKSDNTSPCIYFLDIDLRTSMNGIQLAQEIKNNGGQSFIVFLTTHSEMAMLTFNYKVEALDFIIKDNHDDVKSRIIECISIALKRQYDENTTNNDFFKITMDNMVTYLKFDDIIYFETTKIKHKLRVNTHNSSIEFCGELKGVFSQLDDRFIRCHKSYIINSHKIKSFNKTTDYYVK